MSLASYKTVLESVTNHEQSAAKSSTVMIQKCRRLVWPLVCFEYQCSWLIWKTTLRDAKLYLLTYHVYYRYYSGACMSRWRQCWRYSGCGHNTASFVICSTPAWRYPLCLRMYACQICAFTIQASLADGSFTTTRRPTQMPVWYDTTCQVTHRCQVLCRPVVWSPVPSFCLPHTEAVGCRVPPMNRRPRKNANFLSLYHPFSSCKRICVGICSLRKPTAQYFRYTPWSC